MTEKNSTIRKYNKYEYINICFPKICIFWENYDFIDKCYFKIGDYVAILTF